MDVVATVRQAAEELADRLRAVDSPPVSDESEQARFEQVKAALDDCLARLQPLGLIGVDNRLPSSELWNVCGSLLTRGWLQNQARTKPRGYAGDYEMLSRIYENRLCDDPLGRLFDRYFQEEAAPRAVRNRMAMMTEWIVELASGADPSPLTPLPQRERGTGQALPPGERGIRVAVVGSAFGLEVRDAIAQLAEHERSNVSVTLLDLDWAAIKYAKQKLSGLIDDERLKEVSANLFRLPVREPLAAHLNDTDLLLCPGLFDYFDDATAVAMLRTFWERLAPGGRLAVFQFAPHNPTRAYMEWLGNWYLIYRTERELRQLALDAGLPESQIELSSEPLGVDLLLAATRAE
jgi:extracellular factor (EF) 3-hydroxypalmitic acid methyl ester biosynthesis protein